jgi:hypothetical protein
MEETVRRGHSHERAGLISAAGFAERHHIVGIAAERGDVLLDPGKGGNDVEHPLVAGGRVFLATQLAEIEIA